MQFCCFLLFLFITQRQQIAKWIFFFLQDSLMNTIMTTWVTLQFDYLTIYPGVMPCKIHFHPQFWQWTFTNQQQNINWNIYSFYTPPNKSMYSFTFCTTPKSKQRFTFFFTTNNFLSSSFKFSIYSLIHFSLDMVFVHALSKICLPSDSTKYSQSQNQLFLLPE